MDKNDLLVRALVAHGAVEHCKEDRPCGDCPMSELCGGDCNALLYEVADVMAELIHEVKMGTHRHGQWLRDKDGKLYCSECGCYSDRESNYCPAFGEKMDRGDNGE